MATPSEHPERGERRSLACLFVDLIGSTRLYDRYGDAVGREAVRMQVERCTPGVLAHGGRIVKTIGDALFVVFDRAADAAAAAIDMQRSLAAYNASAPEIPLNVRIGIHAGEVFVEADDVFGDIVNGAARVVHLLDFPGILVTGAVHSGAGPDLQAVCVPLGPVELRGKRDAVSIWICGWEGNAPAAEEYVWSGDKLRHLRLDRERPLDIRLIEGSLFSLGVDALVCSGTTFQHHVRGIEQQFEEDARRSSRAFRVLKRVVPGTPRTCVIYDFDAVPGDGVERRMENLVEGAADRLDPARIRTIGFRLPHRLRSVDLWVARRIASRRWVERRAAGAEWSRIDWVLRETGVAGERESVLAAVVDGILEVRKATPVGVTMTVPPRWIADSAGAEAFRPLTEQGIPMRGDPALGEASLRSVVVWGAVRVFFACHEAARGMTGGGGDVEGT